MGDDAAWNDDGRANQVEAFLAVDWYSSVVVGGLEWSGVSLRVDALWSGTSMQ